MTAHYRGLNYVFALNETWNADAVGCGNNTRYLNHAPDAAANCEARSESYLTLDY